MGMGVAHQPAGGHFLGHWLSAAAMNAAATGDREIRGKAEAVVDGLELCQQANGGEWLGSIPEKYLERIAAGSQVWAPHYTVHKTFMGLLDAYRHIGSAKALELAENWASGSIAGLGLARRTRRAKRCERRGAGA